MPDKPQVLPRIIGVKTTAEPYRMHLTIVGSSELAKMVRLPAALPDFTIARQFLSDFNSGNLRPEPILFSATLQQTRKERT